MSIYIASDHRGIKLSDYLKEQLKNKYNVVSSKVENSLEDDYPDFAFDVCTKMSKEEDYGILICGNGVGIAIAANKVKGIRCGRVVSLDDAIQAKQHNYANVISLPADMEPKIALEIVNKFIETPHAKEDRHLRRVNKIISYENGEYNEL
jgi:ribose 5-phosphate isomerase B